MTRRLPQHLSFKGLVCSEENLVIHARLNVQVRGAAYQEVGPLLMLRVPWSALYDSEMGVHLATLQAAREARAAREAAAELEAEAPTLF